MVEIGENTGTLDNTILRISDIYDREIPETMKKIFTIVEPLIIVLLGGLVLLTVASFFLPLYKIVGGIREDEELNTSEEILSNYRKYMKFRNGFTPFGGYCCNRYNLFDGRHLDSDGLQGMGIAGD